MHEMTETPEYASKLFGELADGDAAAPEKLFPLVYDELHTLALRYMQRERGNHTLQPTALVHEAFLRMVYGHSSQSARFENTGHFVAIAAIVMRRILVDHAKAKKAAKRAGDRVQTQLGDLVDEFQLNSIDLVGLDEALERLRSLDPLQSRLVELRFFGGMTTLQSAEVLNISPRTAYYEWAHAKAWLRSQLEEN
jgi:RNA polymerase sigma factor (TIGR02999 family)